MPKIRTFFCLVHVVVDLINVGFTEVVPLCLVHIKKRSFITSCVFGLENLSEDVSLVEFMYVVFIAG